MTLLGIYIGTGSSGSSTTPSSSGPPGTVVFNPVLGSTEADSFVSLVSVTGGIDALDFLASLAVPGATPLNDIDALGALPLIGLSPAVLSAVALSFVDLSAGLSVADLSTDFSTGFSFDLASFS